MSVSGRCQENVSTSAEVEMRGSQEDSGGERGAVHIQSFTQGIPTEFTHPALLLPHAASWDESISLTDNSFTGGICSPLPRLSPSVHGQRLILQKCIHYILEH